MKLRFILAAVVLFSACKKHNSGSGGAGGNTSMKPYFKDITINETLEDGSVAPFQNALGYFGLKSDPNTQIMVASRGTQELNSGKGFRIAAINKTNGTVNWAKSYDLPDSNYIQLVTCAAIDNGDNIWIGGHSFAGTGTAGILFLAKLDKSGNLLWSGSLSNYQGWRAYSLTVLQNGDIAFFAKGFGGLVVLRLSASQQLVWSTIIDYGTAAVDNDFYGDGNNTLSPENHALVETADGSIYVASSYNPSNTNLPSADRLYRLDANGNLKFANVYAQSQPRTTRPVQLITAGNNLLMADQFVLNNGTETFPFFSLVSPDGSMVTSRGEPVNLSVSTRGLWINEVNYYQGNIYYSSCGDYQFNTYVLDMSLNLKSSIKTIADNDIGTDRGGISLFDPAENALFYLCNFGGNFGESNGFEVTRNDNMGKPCINTYIDAPTALQLENTSIAAAADTTIQNVSAGPAPIFTALGWRTYTVAVVGTVDVCGQ
jgi:hypothetical protein